MKRLVFLLAIIGVGYYVWPRSNEASAGLPGSIIDAASTGTTVSSVDLSRDCRERPAYAMQTLRGKRVSIKGLSVDFHVRGVQANEIDLELEGYDGGVVRFSTSLDRYVRQNTASLRYNYKFVKQGDKLHFFRRTGGQTWFEKVMYSRRRVETLSGEFEKVVAGNVIIHWPLAIPD